jgi:hypothetical protein
MGRFFETRRSPEAVILSAAKDLSLDATQILRCAQDDTSYLAGSFSKKTYSCKDREGRPGSVSLYITGEFSHANDKHI